MLTKPRNRCPSFMVFIEAALAASALTAAYWIDFGLEIPGEEWEQIMAVLLWLIPLKIGIFAALGLYGEMWRQASRHHFRHLAGACMYSSLSAVGIGQFLYGSTDFSREIFFLDGVFTFALTGATRVGIRTCHSPGHSKDLAIFRPRKLPEIRYEDLLNRPPVRLDSAGIEDFLKGRKILVTGAGGSIGSELCRQLIRFFPRELILVDAGEANLYAIQMKLCHELHFDACPVILSRVQDQGLMETVFDAYRPEVIFHAAACKHVPMLEWHPWEAVFSNVVGSRVVMEMAAKYHSSDFVLVSTDKAVRPTSVMGTTKRIAELSMQSLKGNGTRFTAVRFGNVLASSGSVIPLFRRQIECGGPVTVCHPEVTRYFMTIPEAAQLILQAGAQGEDGDISVLEMGAPVRIADMAVDLIRLCGKEPGRDIQIVFTGLRPGEKLHEELITADEDFTRSGHEKIMVVKSNGKWNWNGMETQEAFREWLDQAVEELCRAARAHDPLAIRKSLKRIVPEYLSPTMEDAASALNPLNPSADRNN